MNRNRRVPPPSGWDFLAPLLLAAPQVSAVKPMKLGPLTLVLGGTRHATTLYGSDTGEMSTPGPARYDSGDLALGLGVSVDADYGSTFACARSLAPRNQTLLTWGAQRNRPSLRAWIGTQPPPWPVSRIDGLPTPRR